MAIKIWSLHRSKNFFIGVWLYIHILFFLTEATYSKINSKSNIFGFITNSLNLFCSAVILLVFLLLFHQPRPILCVILWTCKLWTLVLCMLTDPCFQKLGEHRLKHWLYVFTCCVKTTLQTNWLCVSVRKNFRFNRNTESAYTKMEILFIFPFFKMVHIMIKKKVNGIYVHIY